MMKKTLPFALMLTMLWYFGTAFAAPGDLDLSFGTGGTQSTGLHNAGTGEDNTCKAAAIQSDGKLVVAGTVEQNGWDELYVARIESNGRLDLSFGVYGVRIATLYHNWEYLNAVAFQSDGKILVAGGAKVGAYTKYSIVRFTAGGDVDTTFGTNGLAEVDDQLIGMAIYDIQVESDDSLYLSGTSAYDKYMTVISMDKNGGLKTSWGVSGKGYEHVNDGNMQNITAQGRVITRQGAPYHGTLLLAGPGKDSSGSDWDFVFGRAFSTNGNIDGSFGTNGLTVVGTANDDYLYDMIITAPSDPLSGFYAAGYTGDITTSTDVWGIFLDDDGDTSTLKTTTIDIGTIDVATSLKYISGYLLYTGYTDHSAPGGSYNFFAACEGPFGSLKTSFGASGKQVIAFSSSAKCHTSLYSDSWTDFSLYLVGETEGMNKDIAIAKIDPVSGSLITSFGARGKLEQDLPTESNDLFNAAAYQSDGKLVAVGAAEGNMGNDLLIARYNANGQLDQTFGVAGVKVVDAGGHDAATDVAIQPDGKIVFSGRSGSKGVVGRLTTSGALDTGFGSSGLVITSYTSYDSFEAVAIQSDGKILAAGLADNDAAVLRLNSTGQADTSFGTTGLARQTIGGSGCYASDIALQQDGKIVVSVDDVQQSFTAVRFTAGGQPDSSFGSNGVAAVNTGGSSDCNALAVQSDGKILLAGDWNDSFAVMRLNSDGSVDSTFGTTGLATANFSAGDSGRSVQVLSGGKILVGGDYQTAGATNSFAVVRYFADGQVDTNFGSNGLATAVFNGADFSYGSTLNSSNSRIVLCGSTTDASGNMDAALAAFDITGGLPSGGNDSASTTENTAVTVNVLSNDSDPQGDPLSVIGAAQPTNGSTSFTANDVTYTPNPGFTGTDTFTYTISDGSDQATGTVTVTVTSGGGGGGAPTATDDSASTPVDQVVDIPVLDNDSDPDGDPLSIDSISTPSHGNASDSGKGTILYDPDPGYTGTDTFTYTISDGTGNTATATVTVTVGGGGSAMDITGWWYTPSEPGTGLSIGISNDGQWIFLAWYAYESGGMSAWWVAWAERQGTSNRYEGDLLHFTGNPVNSEKDGIVAVDFHDSSNALLMWDLQKTRGNPDSRNIEKYLGSLDSGADDPLNFNGWYEDQVNHPATGIFVEAKGTTLYLGWYYYRGDGTPVWEVMGGFMDPGGFNTSSGTYTATVKELENGQSLTGAFQPANTIEPGRQGTLTFSPGGTSMSFSCDGKVYTLNRFTVGHP